MSNESLAHSSAETSLDETPTTQLPPEAQQLVHDLLSICRDSKETVDHLLEEYWKQLKLSGVVSGFETGGNGVPNPEYDKKSEELYAPIVTHRDTVHRQISECLGKLRLEDGVMDDVETANIYDGKLKELYDRMDKRGRTRIGVRSGAVVSWDYMNSMAPLGRANGSQRIFVEVGEKKLMIELPVKTPHHRAPDIYTQGNWPSVRKREIYIDRMEPREDKPGTYEYDEYDRIELASSVIRAIALPIIEEALSLSPNSPK